MKKTIFIILILIMISAILLISAIGQDWTIQDNSVYINDPNVFINATPYLVSPDGYVTFNFVSKVFTGNIDMVFGFDTNQTMPQSIQLYQPTNQTRTKSYSCGGFFNYTLSPNHFWCWKNVTTVNGLNQTNGSYYVLLSEHDFDSGNISTATAYWNESYVENWTDYSSTFSSLNYNYEGMNKWYYNQNIPIVQGQSYTFRVKIKQLNPTFSSEQSKYWFAIKPSFETIQQAITNGHLYSLDPWTSGLSVGLTDYWTMDIVNSTWTGTYNNITATYDLKIVNTTNNVSLVNGLINKAFNTSGSIDSGNYTRTTTTRNFNNSWSLNGWFNATALANEQTNGFMQIDPAVAGTTNGLITYVRSNGTVCVQEVGGGNPGTTCGNVTIATNKNVMLTTLSNSTHVIVYVNSTLTLARAINARGDWTSQYLQIPRSEEKINGWYDEIGLWENRTISESEISALFNSGAGLIYGATDPSNVSVISPTGTYTSVTGIPFNASANSGANTLGTCLYYVTRGASVEVANTSVTCVNASAGNMNGTFSVSGDATYTFHFWVNDTFGTANESTSNFTISTPAAGGSGGGGSTTIIQTVANTTNQTILPGTCQQFTDALDNSRTSNPTMGFLDFILNFWKQIADVSLCKSAASVYPIDIPQ